MPACGTIQGVTPIGSRRSIDFAAGSPRQHLQTGAWRRLLTSVAAFNFARPYQAPDCLGSGNAVLDRVSLHNRHVVTVETQIYLLTLPGSRPPRFPFLFVSHLCYLKSSAALSGQATTN
jgi:hypothetical protein